MHNKKSTSYEMLILFSNFLSSQIASNQVLSAFTSLTSVFGMGTGVSITPSLPDLRISPENRTQSLLWSSPRPISAGPLNMSPCFHSRSINLIVFKGPYLLSNGRSHLGGGFTLRCLQRLSLPDLATQLCHWRDNWSTIGPSTPVLSY